MSFTKGCQADLALSKETMGKESRRLLVHPPSWISRWVDAPGLQFHSLMKYSAMKAGLGVERPGRALVPGPPPDLLGWPWPRLGFSAAFLCVRVEVKYGDSGLACCGVLSTAVNAQETLVTCLLQALCHELEMIFFTYSPKFPFLLASWFKWRGAAVTLSEGQQTPLRAVCEGRLCSDGVWNRNKDPPRAGGACGPHEAGRTWNFEGNLVSDTGAFLALDLRSLSRQQHVTWLIHKMPSITWGNQEYVRSHALI